MPVLSLSTNPLNACAIALAISSIFFLNLSLLIKSYSLLIPRLISSAIDAPSPYQSFFLNASTIFWAISSASFPILANASFHFLVYSSKSWSSIVFNSGGTRLPELPRPLRGLSSSFFSSLSCSLRTFNSSKPRMVFFSFFAFSFSLSSSLPRSLAESVVSPKFGSSISPRVSSSPPIPAVMPLMSAPISPAIHWNSFCNAITTALMYGRTNFKTGRRRLPIVLARTVIFCLISLN